MEIRLRPIGTVHNTRRDLTDDGWEAVVSTIELDETLGPEALAGIESFSHCEVVFFFHRVPEAEVVRDARHPRDNPAWPRVGILAQRGKNRPNRLGVTAVRVLGRRGKVLEVGGLDAVDGTPVLDIKPVLRAFLPRGAVREPEWAAELMRHYWQGAEAER